MALTNNITVNAGMIQLIPTFTGDQRTGPKIEQWIAKIEGISHMAGWDDAEKCTVARITCSDTAQLHVTTTEILKSTKNWTDFKNSMLNRFKVDQPQAYKVQKYYNCRQLPNENVLDYATRLKALAYKTINLEGSKEQVAKRKEVLEEGMKDIFLLGLNDNIKRDVVMSKPDDLETAIKNAVSMELAELMLKGRKLTICSLEAIDKEDDMSPGVASVVNKPADSNKVPPKDNFAQKARLPNEYIPRDQSQQNDKYPSVGYRQNGVANRSYVPNNQRSYGYVSEYRNNMNNAHRYESGNRNPRADNVRTYSNGNGNGYGNGNYRGYRNEYRNSMSNSNSNARNNRGYNSVHEPKHIASTGQSRDHMLNRAPIRKEDIQCFSCGRKGHYARECRGRSTNLYTAHTNREGTHVGAANGAIARRGTSSRKNLNE